MMRRILGLISFFIVLNFVYSCAPQSGPAHQAEKANIAKYQLSQGEVITITNSVRGRLKDPDSARFSNIAASRDLDKERMYYFCGKVNAKNGFGGYTGDKYYWGSLIKDGEKAGVIIIGLGGNDNEQAAIIQMCYRQVAHIDE